jgi:hypothetical protein
MTTNNNELHSKQLLSKQWQTLHNSHEQYEHLSLVIKLLTIVVTTTLVSLSFSLITTLLIVSILWLQEGIWKTFQARACSAIIKLEEEMTSNSHIHIYPLYNDWQNNRPSTIKLINEYISNALKPTVIFPYAPLMVIVCIASV